MHNAWIGRWFCIGVAIALVFCWIFNWILRKILELEKLDNDAIYAKNKKVNQITNRISNIWIGLIMFLPLSLALIDFAVDKWLHIPHFDYYFSLYVRPIMLVLWPIGVGGMVSKIYIGVWTTVLGLFMIVDDISSLIDIEFTEHPEFLRYKKVDNHGK